MKRLSAIFLLALTAVSCKKTETSDTPQTGNFIITGVRDADLSNTSNSAYSFPVSVTQTGSARDTVTLNGDFLPGGVFASFQPQVGITPFTSLVTFSTDFSTGGGTYPCKVKGVGHSGTRYYDLNVTVAAFRGWKLGSIVYTRTGLVKETGNGVTYPSIRVSGPGGQTLILSFSSKGALPLKNATYKIAADSNTADNVQIAMYDGAHIYRATGFSSDGVKGVTGTFSFDTLKKFTFHCANVQMSDGTEKLPLECNFSE